MKRLQQTKQVLGSLAFLTLVVEDKSSELIFNSLWQRINEFEQKFSRFLPDSELSKFNSRAGNIVRISPEFEQLLRKTKLMSKKTHDVFNPFILPSLQRAGYIGSWNEKDLTGIPDHSDLTTIPNHKQLIIRKGSAKIPSNSALDLGGIGKGYLLDQLVEFLEKENICRYWLSLGGDIICNGNDLNDQPWQVAISNASSLENDVDRISNFGKKIAIATSGIVKRQGYHKDKHWHHLIDPSTNEPAQTDILTATVCADSATNADIAAKCLVIRGSKNLEETAKLLPIGPILLQLGNGKIIRRK